MGRTQNPSNGTSEPKKRRRVGFAEPVVIDVGIEANKCITLYLVSSKEEVEGGSGCCTDPVDLGSFFGDDEKIYGYEGLKITIWFSITSFRGYVDITYDSVSDRGKGITDLKASFEDIFGETLVENKEEFLQTFSTECDYISSIVSNGEKLQWNSSYGNSNFISHSKAEEPNAEVIRFVGKEVGELYSRLLPLVFLLIDGSNPIEVSDVGWELYLLVQKTLDQQEACKVRLLGFAAVFRFYRYPDSSRLRLGQILVLPPFQRKGYGLHLLEVLSQIAINENVYDFTIEEPVASLQRLRYCIDIPRLLTHSSVRQATEAAASQLKETNLSKKKHTFQLSQFLPPSSTIEDARKSLKISKKQFNYCWEILIYLALDRVDKYMRNYKTFITDRVRASLLGKESGSSGKRVVDVPNDHGESFVMYKSEDGDGKVMEVDENVGNQEEQLEEYVTKKIAEIKLIAENVSKCHS